MGITKACEIQPALSLGEYW